MERTNERAKGIADREDAKEEGIKGTGPFIGKPNHK
jgi:hypothetical protein